MLAGLAAEGAPGRLSVSECQFFGRLYKDVIQPTTLCRVLYANYLTALLAAAERDWRHDTDALLACDARCSGITSAGDGSAAGAGSDRECAALRTRLCGGGGASNNSKCTAATSGSSITAAAGSESSAAAAGSEPGSAAAGSDASAAAAGSGFVATLPETTLGVSLSFQAMRCHGFTGQLGGGNLFEARQ